MLIEFSVGNFCSFKDRVALNMAAAKRDKTLPENVIQSAQGTGLDILKTVAIYGANASGKSNLFKAMNFMGRFVRRSSKEVEKDSPIAVSPFKLNEAFLSKPSTFEVIFLEKEVRYVYGFAVDSKMVHREWLYSYPQNQPRLLFERVESEGTGAKLHYKFGPHWKGEKRNLVKLTRPNALFISVASQFNNEIADRVVSWFSKEFMFYSREFDIVLREFFKENVHENRKIRDEVLKFLKYADLGIDNFRMKKLPFSDVKFLKQLTPERREIILAPFIDVLPKDVYEVLTVHKGLDSEGKPTDIVFEFDEESAGTTNFFNLSVPCILALRDAFTLVVDEFESSLHPLLTQWIIRRFNSEQKNPDGAQLIFMTHDSSLLEGNLLRRDQVWFTEKNPEGGTELYSLWDYKRLPKKQENIRKGYLAGRYGAIPFLDDLAGWGADHG